MLRMCCMCSRWYVVMCSSCAPPEASSISCILSLLRCACAGQACAAHGLSGCLSHVTSVSRHLCLTSPLSHVTSVSRHLCLTSPLSHVTSVSRHFCLTSPRYPA
jgi:hypothetical protein